MTRPWRSAGARAALGTLALLALAALVAPLLLPDPAAAPDPLGARLLVPSLAHPLGTDALSRDVLARLAHGTGISLRVGLLAALVAGALGAFVGLGAAAAGGLADDLLMRGTDALASIPRAFAVLFAVAAWPGMPLGGFTLLLGITGWMAVARIVAAEGRRMMAGDAVAAARALGAGRRRIILRHLLPNAAGQLIVATALGVGEAMLLEAGLSFLGAGVRPPTPSLGTLLHDGKDALAAAPWLTVAPGLVLTAAVLATNRLGDALRDAFDPRQR